MTTPYERTRTVIQAREFLQELMQSADVAESVRKEAHRLLRHFPSNDDLELTASAFPDWWAKPVESNIMKAISMMLLSTGEVAKLLHVSLPYINKLLDNGTFAGAQKTEGGDWRVPRAAVLEYKVQMKKRQSKGSADIVRASRELGLYDHELDGIPKPPKSR